MFFNKYTITFFKFTKILEKEYIKKKDKKRYIVVINVLI